MSLNKEKKQDNSENLHERYSDSGNEDTSDCSSRKASHANELTSNQLSSSLIHYYFPSSLYSSPPTSSPPTQLLQWQAYEVQPKSKKHSDQIKTKRNKSSEKEHKRRISHNVIEKRRREKMNDMIEKLKSLIPSCNTQYPVSIQQPIHKLSVLQAAVNYIEDLHEILQANLSQDSPLLKEISIMQRKE